jgi:hypothetical protein
LNEVLVKSAIPLVGLPIRPRKPFPTPLIKPFFPPCFAPSFGFVTRPLTPNLISYKKIYLLNKFS